MKSSSGKSFTIWSSNPKMNTAPQPAIRGYKDGGVVTYSAPAVYQPRKNAPRNIDYAPYDTTMEAQAKAPPVFAGQAPKVSQKTAIAQPGPVTYYNTGMAGEANRISQQRWDAYNRRLQNEAIRTGNPLPGTQRPDASFVEEASQAQKKAAHYGSKVREPVSIREQVASMRQDMQSKLEQSPFYTNKATAIAELEEQLKRRKKKEA